MSDISASIQAQIGRPIAAAEFSRLLDLIATQQQPADQQASITHLLRVAKLSPEQMLALACTEAVRASLALQLVLKRYVRERQYAAERKQFEERSDWVRLMEVLSGFPPI